MDNSKELVVKPKLDVVFKILFTEHIDLLKTFLSAALNLPESEFAEIKVLNPEIAPETAEEKYARLDVVVNKPDGTKINVELQNGDENNFKERSIFYCSKLFTRDVSKGKDYALIPKTVCINIVQFPLFPDEGYICTVFPTIQESGNIVSDKWEIIYFQTLKLPQDLSDDLSQWLKFFTITTQEEMINMDARTQSAGIKKAIKIVETMNDDDWYRSLARVREETLFNERLALGAAYEKGSKQAIFNVARDMHKLGMPIDQIKAITKLTDAEIKDLI
jgi:predicted transposase/invertase (TIGR01784 family)